jgi:essential nuclear protein 1
MQDDDDEDDMEDDAASDEYVDEVVVSLILSMPPIYAKLNFSQELDSGDMDALDALLPKNAGERKTLADIIFAKLESGETPGAAVIQKARQSQHLPCLIWPNINAYLRTDGDHPDPSIGLDPKVVEAYTKYARRRFILSSAVHDLYPELGCSCRNINQDLCQRCSKLSHLYLHGPACLH